MSLQEIVAMFLYTLAHHKKNRSIGQYFFRSGETVSRQFHLCLRDFLKFHEVLLYNPTPISDDCEDERWKSYKNCLGALDGTYINVMCLHKNDQSSAHDMRVLLNALSRPNGFRVPRGNYYFVDAGYTNCEGFLAPYRGQRYHLKEWTNQQPESAEEFYNMKHARVRNVIERCFGLLKGRWSILRSPSFFPIRTHGRIVMACCLLHNLIRKFMPTDDINEDELNESDDDSESDSDDEREFITSGMFYFFELILSVFLFGRDAEKKLLQVDKAVYDEWVKTHKKAKGLYGVPFVHYETLAEIYAKDKATGDVSESFVDAIEGIDQEIDKQPLIVESDEEDDVNSTNSDTYSSTSQSGKRPSLCRNDDDDLVASLHDVSNNFGKIFENINVNLGTMASAWSKAEEREQRMDEKVNKVLDEVMKLDGISPSEALEVATILMAEEHKLRIFYQAPFNMKNQYAIDLLKKK
uniref:DDE Tnp4 domain-containing protein n=1 Tax=Chenopodium quinoa TaxID=63459 RepID=A0A803L6V7_CHEQI